MAVIKHGLLGNFSGAIGSVQGARWKSIPYMQGRVTSNGLATTNKAIAQKTRFATCRNTLSQLKSEWESYIVGKGSKKLPAWQTWIKLVEATFFPSQDLFVYTPSISLGKDYRSVNVEDYHVDDFGSYNQLEMYIANPLNDPNATLRTCIWSRGQNVFIDKMSVFSSYSTTIVLPLDKIIYPVGSYVIFLVYVGNGGIGKCSDSRYNLFNINS